MTNKIRLKLNNKVMLIIVLSIVFLLGIIAFSIKVFSINFAENDYTLNNAKITGYETNGKELTSTTADSRIEIASSNLFLSSLQIFFDKPLEQDSNIAIYYNTGKGYSENEKSFILVKKGDTQSELVSVNVPISNIRIDLGNKAGETFSVSKISVNYDSGVSTCKTKYIIKNLIKLFLYLFIYIIIVFLIIKKYFKIILSLIINLIIRLFKFLFTKKSLLKISGGIIVIVIGLTIEFIAGYSSINKLNNKTDFKIENSSVISKDILLENGNIVTQTEKSSMIINLEDKYIKDLAIKIENGRGTPLQVKINGQLIEKKNYWDPYLQADKFNQVPVVFYVNQKVNTIEIISESSQVIISDMYVLNHYVYNFPRGIFYAGILLMGYCVFIVVKKKQVKVETIFVIISITIGSIFALTMPLKTLMSWDDEIHFLRSAQLLNSDGNYLTSNEKGYFDRIFPSTYSLSERELLDEYLQNNNELSSMKSSRNIIFYSQIGYLPSASVLFLGRIFKLPYNIVFILGRWINVLVFSAVVYLAIKKLKTGKIIMAIIALFPTSIFLSANYNYDSWVTCFTMFGLAYLFSELQQPNKIIKTKEWVIMLSAFFFGLGPKAIYFPLMLLLFLLRPSKFESKKKYNTYKWVTVISICLVVFSFSLPFIFAGKGGGDLRGGSEVNSMEQIKFILSSPIEYANILYTFIKNYISLENMNSYVTLLAYMGNSKNFMLILCIFVIALFTDKNDYDRYTSTIKVRASVAFVYITTVMLICTALYVSFTAVGSSTIAGVQGRYLMPLVFPLSAVLGSCKIRHNIKKEVYILGMLFFPTIVLLQTIWELCIKFYY